MTRLTNRSGASTPFAAWTTVFYLLLVFIAPFAFMGSAHAQEETPQENYGTGMHFVWEAEKAPLLTCGIVIGIDLGTTYSYVT